MGDWSASRIVTFTPGTGPLALVFGAPMQGNYASLGMRDESEESKVREGTAAGSSNTTGLNGVNTVLY